MVSETHIYYLNIYFSCKHSNIIATFLSQGELNKNLICHINFVQKCRYPKPVGSINPYLPYYFIKTTLKALGIFRPQQNGQSNAFFLQGTSVSTEQTALVYRVQMLDVLRQLAANILCQAGPAASHTQSCNLGLSPRFCSLCCHKYFKLPLLIKTHSCFSLLLGC